MSIDPATLPANVQELIAAAVADALRANEPAPPRELTAGERARLSLLAAENAARGDHAVANPVGEEIRAILAALALVIEAVYPDDALPDTRATNAGASSEPHMVNVAGGR